MLKSPFSLSNSIQLPLGVLHFAAQLFPWMPFISKTGSWLRPENRLCALVPKREHMLRIQRMIDNFRRLNYIYADFSLNSVLEMAREFMTKHSHSECEMQLLWMNISFSTFQALNFKYQSPSILYCSLIHSDIFMPLWAELNISMSLHLKHFIFRINMLSKIKRFIKILVDWQVKYIGH